MHEALGLDCIWPAPVCATGGAAISKDTHLFFLNLGIIITTTATTTTTTTNECCHADIRLVEVYGSTESLGPQMQGLHAPGTNRVGSVGRVAAGLAEGKVASWHGDT